jgi:hypothetical protein
MGRWKDADRVRTALQRMGIPSELEVADAVYGDRDPVVRLLATEAGRRIWYEATGFGCNPVNDLLWVDSRFRAAAQGLGIAPCPLAQQPRFPPR